MNKLYSLLFVFGFVLLSATAGVAQEKAGSRAKENPVVGGAPGGAKGPALGFSYSGGRMEMLPSGAPRWTSYPKITEIIPTSPAGKVGLAVGDVLLEVNGVDARDPRTLLGDKTQFKLRIRRGSTVREFLIDLKPSSASKPG